MLCKMLDNFSGWHDYHSYPPLKIYVAWWIDNWLIQLGHLQLLFCCINKCKRRGIIYHRMVFSVISYTQEYRSVLMPREDIPCINIGSWLLLIYSLFWNQCLYWYIYHIYCNSAIVPVHLILSSGAVLFSVSMCIHVQLKIY